MIYDIYSENDAHMLDRNIFVKSYVIDHSLHWFDIRNMYTEFPCKKISKFDQYYL